MRVAVVVGAGVGVVALALRDTSPVGHFTSAAAKDRFVTAYDRAMADLPPPQRTLDVRTSFGVSGLPIRRRPDHQGSVSAASLRWFPKAWRDSFASWTAGGAPVKDVPVAQMIEAGMQTYALSLPAPGRIPEDHIAAIDQPVLVIMAGRSPMHDSTAAAELARRRLQHGTVRVYPEASHAINGEYPDEITADIDAFLTATE